MKKNNEVTLETSTGLNLYVDSQVKVTVNEVFAHFAKRARFTPDDCDERFLSKTEYAEFMLELDKRQEANPEILSDVKITVDKNSNGNVIMYILHREKR